MLKNEFLKRMDAYGIDLDAYQIVVDSYSPVSYVLGVCKNGNKWIIYEVGDRNSVDVMYEETSESAIFDEFYQEVLERLHTLGYVTEYISKQVIQTPKSYVCDFLKKKYRNYDISESDIEDMWKYLLYDFHVLNEVKYFARNNKFVPADGCYKIEGYSAQNIYNQANLAKISAYSYLVYLEKNPKRALKNLPKLK